MHEYIYDLVYVLVFLGSKCQMAGWGAMNMRRGLRGWPAVSVEMGKGMGRYEVLNQTATL